MRNWKFALMVLTTAGIVTTSALADQVTPNPISPGTYRANVMPIFNHDMADRIQKQLKTVPGLDSVSTRSEDSTIHFTVKDKTTVDLNDLQKALNTADAGAVMSSPVLEHTLIANPGL